MMATDANQARSFESLRADTKKIRCASQSHDPAILADVYREETNIVVWQRELSAGLEDSVERFLTSKRSFQTALTVAPQNGLSAIRQSLGATRQSELSEDIAELVEMFCCLFGLRRAGLRLAVLDLAMCPKFHVDRVPCRLVTTYRGAATEWLPHDVVDRSKLGPGNSGQRGTQSGVLRSRDDIRQLGCGDVALLKGELWEGNENAGLVHRSPEVSAGASRLLLTLDFCG